MKKYRRKEIAIGFAVGLIANIFGIFLWWLIFFFPTDIEATLTFAYEEGTLGAIIGPGAILNLVAFFLFIRMSYDLRAKGVLLATFISAFVILFLKFW